MAGLATQQVGRSGQRLRARHTTTSRGDHPVSGIDTPRAYACAPLGGTEVSVGICQGSSRECRSHLLCWYSTTRRKQRGRRRGGLPDGGKGLSGNRLMQVKLGSALLRQGKKEEAIALITGAVNASDDVSVLNDGAYSLVSVGIECVAAAGRKERAKGGGAGGSPNPPGPRSRASIRESFVARTCCSPRGTRWIGSIPPRPGTTSRRCTCAHHGAARSKGCTGQDPGEEGRSNRGHAGL